MAARRILRWTYVPAELYAVPNSNIRQEIWEGIKVLPDDFRAVRRPAAAVLR